MIWNEWNEQVNNSLYLHEERMIDIKSVFI